MGLLVFAMALDVVRYRISGGDGDGDANVGTIRSRRQDSAEILSTSGPSHAAKRELSRRLEEQLSNPNKKGARRHKGDGLPSQGGSPLLPKRLSSSLRVNPDSGGKSSKDKGKGKEKETGTGEVMLYLVVREDLKMSAGKVASVRSVFPLCPPCACPQLTTPVSHLPTSGSVSPPSLFESNAIDLHSNVHMQPWAPIGTPRCLWSETGRCKARRLSWSAARARPRCA
jgi:hypothetical protein